MRWGFSGGGADTLVEHCLDRLFDLARRNWISHMHLYLHLLSLFPSPNPSSLSSLFSLSSPSRLQVGRYSSPVSAVINDDHVQRRHQRLSGSIATIHPLSPGPCREDPRAAGRLRHQAALSLPAQNRFRGLNLRQQLDHTACLTEHGLGSPHMTTPTWYSELH